MAWGQKWSKIKNSVNQIGRQEKCNQKKASAAKKVAAEKSTKVADENATKVCDENAIRTAEGKASKDDTMDQV